MLTDLDLSALPENPRDKQKAMALAVTASRHGLAAAQKAQVDAASLVGGAGDAAADVPEASLAEVNFPAKAFYLLSAVGICASSSEARRQIKGGAARLEGEKITDPNQEFTAAADLLETANKNDPIIPGRAAGIITFLIVSDFVAPSA